MLTFEPLLELLTQLAHEHNRQLTLAGRKRIERTEVIEGQTLEMKQLLASVPRRLLTQAQECYWQARQNSQSSSDRLDSK